MRALEKWLSLSLGQEGCGMSLARLVLLASKRGVGNLPYIELKGHKGQLEELGNKWDKLTLKKNNACSGRDASESLKSTSS